MKTFWKWWESLSPLAQSYIAAVFYLVCFYIIWVS